MSAVRALAGRRARRVRGRDRGVASLELLGMVPLALVFAVLVVQVAGFMFAVTSTNEAVRAGARQQSLDGSGGCQAARDVLADSLDVADCRDSGGRLGDRPSVRLVVEIPVVDVVEDLVPEVRVTREARLP